MSRYVCRLYAEPVLPHQRRGLLLRVIAIEADAPDTAAFLALDRHESERHRYPATDSGRLPCHEVITTPEASR